MCKEQPSQPVDFIAMVLLALGVLRSRQGRAASALGFLTGGWGWLGIVGLAWSIRLMTSAAQ